MIEDKGEGLDARTVESTDLFNGVLIVARWKHSDGFKVEWFHKGVLRADAIRRAHGAYDVRWHSGDGSGIVPRERTLMYGKRSQDYSRSVKTERGAIKAVQKYAREIGAGSSTLAKQQAYDAKRAARIAATVRDERTAAESFAELVGKVAEKYPDGFPDDEGA